jgi:aspartate aminotransferase
MQGQFTSGASSVSQKAAEAALANGLASTREMCNAFLRRRNLMLSLVRRIPGIKVNEPHGAFYVFPDVRFYLGKSDGEKKMNNVNDLCMYLIYKAHVSTVPGSAFGDENCIRISYSASDELIQKAMERIHSALTALK